MFRICKFFDVLLRNSKESSNELTTVFSVLLRNCERVKDFPDKGFGFAFFHTLKCDVFFHVRDIVSRELPLEGDVISCHMINTDRGLQAKKIRVI